VGWGGWASELARPEGEASASAAGAVVRHVVIGVGAPRRHGGHPPGDRAKLRGQALFPGRLPSLSYPSHRRGGEARAGTWVGCARAPTRRGQPVRARGGSEASSAIRAPLSGGRPHQSSHLLVAAAAAWSRVGRRGSLTSSGPTPARARQGHACPHHMGSVPCRCACRSVLLDLRPQAIRVFRSSCSLLLTARGIDSVPPFRLPVASSLRRQDKAAATVRSCCLGRRWAGVRVGAARPAVHWFWAHSLLPHAKGMTTPRTWGRPAAGRSRAWPCACA
jgi:hypothetical protein